MKLASWKTLGGPWGKEPEEPVKRTFDRASTDIDVFRNQVFISSFLDEYAIEPAMRDGLATNDEGLLRLRFDGRRHVLFNEQTIGLEEAVMHTASAEAERHMGAG